MMLSFAKWICTLSLSLVASLALADVLPEGHPHTESPTTKTAFKLSFQNKDYLFRHYTPNDNPIFEFTPADQDNLETWTDMMTIVDLSAKATSPSTLNKVFAGIIQKYKSENGKIVKNEYTPGKGDKPTSAFAVAAFVSTDPSDPKNANKSQWELVFARLFLSDGKGLATIYSHRYQGDAKIGNQFLTDQTGPVRTALEKMKIPEWETLDKLRKQ